MTKILALDYGTKRIGVAVSDALLLTAQQRDTIYRKNQSQVLDVISSIIRNDQISLIVIGLPLNMDGTESEKSKQAALFADTVHKETLVPVELWDERLTSRQADRTMISMNTRRDKRKKRIDQMAAVLILQNYLDAHPRVDGIDKNED